MIAKQTVYIETTPTGEQGSATTTPPSCGRMLIREGQEINEAQLEKYPGALELAGGTKKAARHSDDEKVETREPATTHRDPGHKKHR